MPELKAGLKAYATTAQLHQKVLIFLISQEELTKYHLQHTTNYPAKSKQLHSNYINSLQMSIRVN